MLDEPKLTGVEIYDNRREAAQEIVAKHAGQRNAEGVLDHVKAPAGKAEMVKLESSERNQGGLDNGNGLFLLAVDGGGAFGARRDNGKAEMLVIQRRAGGGVQEEFCRLSIDFEGDKKGAGLVGFERDGVSLGAEGRSETKEKQNA